MKSFKIKCFFWFQGRFCHQNNKLLLMMSLKRSKIILSSNNNLIVLYAIFYSKQLTLCFHHLKSRFLLFKCIKFRFLIFFRSIFITGSAGVGKSFLLQKIIDCLPKRKVYVTASTGVAACNIGGSTLHRYVYR